MSYIDPDMIIWVDKTGSDNQCEGIRKFGYSLWGMTLVSFKLGINGKRPSVIAAMSSPGVEDIDLGEGTTMAKLSVPF